jgi:NAD(P)H-hydrate epimerase
VTPICAGAAFEAMTEPWPERGGEMRYDPDRLAAAIAGKAAVAAGPGLGTARAVRDVVLWLLRYSEVPVVLDADALNVLARNPAPLRRSTVPVVLTPHPGEMARLAGIDTAAVQADRVGVARAFAAEHGCVVVLKGARTVVAAAQRVCVNPTGNPGMASGGMGDALTGLIGALLAQGLGTAEAASLGVYLHGLAGDLAALSGAVGMVASDLIELLPAAAAQVDELAEN